jgi:tRNA(adenine34) deaminase
MLFLGEAIKQALIAAEKDEVPVGAVIVKDGKIIAKAYNQVETFKDSTAHAEILAIKQASEKLGNHRLIGCELYTTLEPCPMCAGAILHARLKSVVYAAKDFKWGSDGSILSILKENDFNHTCTTKFIPNENYVETLKAFFKNKR